MKNVTHKKPPKSERLPRDLFEYMTVLPHWNSLLESLLKHQNKILALPSYNDAPVKIKAEIFVLELNKFKCKLDDIFSLLCQMQLEIKEYELKIEKNKEYFSSIDSKKLSERVRDFFCKANRYYQHFTESQIFQTISVKSFINDPLPDSLLHISTLPNEENAINLVIGFSLHDSFFTNFLNLLYSDEKKGEKFLGHSFLELAAEYSWLKKISDEITKKFPMKEYEQMKESFEAKKKSLNSLLKGHPATLYLALSKIVDYFDESDAVPGNL